MHMPYDKKAIAIALATMMLWLFGALAWGADAPHAKVSFIDEPDHFAVVISSQQVLKHRLMTAGKMNSPVLDIDAVMDGQARFVTPKMPGAARVAVEWYKSAPPTMRIRVRLSRDLKFDLAKHNGGRELVLSVGKTPSVSVDEQAPSADEDVSKRPVSETVVLEASEEAVKNSAVVLTDTVIAKPVVKPAEKSEAVSAEQPASAKGDVKGASSQTKPAVTPKKVEAVKPPLPVDDKPKAQIETKPEVKPSAVPNPAIPSAPPALPQPVVQSGDQAQMIERSNVPSQSSSSLRLSLNFSKADLPTVLRSLAMQSGANIVVGSNVKGDVSLNLQNVTLTEALDYISTVYGVKVQFDGKTYIVNTTEQVKEGGTGPTAIDMVPFTHTSAKLMQDVLTTTFPALRVKVSMLSDTTSKMRGISTQFVTFIGAKDDVENAKKLVSQLEALHQKEKEDVFSRIYRVKHSKVQDLFSTIGWMIPTVKVYIGPRNTQSPASETEKKGELKFNDIDLEATASAVGGKSADGTSPSETASSPSTSSPSGTPSGDGGQASKGGEKMQIVDDTSNTIVLMGPRIDVEKAIQTLSELDVSKPQVMIEAKIVDLSDGLENTFGFAPDFSGSTAHFEIDDRGRLNILRTIDPTTSLNDVFTTIATPLAIETHLKALVDKNRAKLLANPKSMTMEGIPSTLFIGDTLRYISSIMQTTTGITITTEQVEVGVKLQCRAKLAGNDEVVLTVEPEISSITDITLNPQGVALPRISKRMSTNTVRMKSGETLVLSGLIREVDIKKSSKIPLLGDLPIFGYLFRQDSSTKSKSEVVVFVTATIVDEGGEAVKDSISESKAAPAETLK